MNGDHFIFLASDVMIPLVGLGSLLVVGMFAWFAPWSRRDRRTR